MRISEEGGMSAGQNFGCETSGEGGTLAEKNSECETSGEGGTSAEKNSGCETPGWNDGGEGFRVRDIRIDRKSVV